MGLRAFSSQLLCEQVVGRGLRRTSYEVNKEGLFDAEYVNIFGIPFSFLPHEKTRDCWKPPPPTTEVRSLECRRHMAIRWPNVDRIHVVYAPELTLNWESIPSLPLRAMETRMLAELAPVVEDKPDTSRITEVNLERLAKDRERLQHSIFRAARQVYDEFAESWTGSKGRLIGQVVRLIEEFVGSERLQIHPAVFCSGIRFRLLVALNIGKIARHVGSAIRFKSVRRRELIFNQDQAICSTEDMQPWYTARKNRATTRSHINRCVLDSTWEASDADVLDRHEAVVAWAKNDHLGFEIHYVHRGAVRKYRPDFLVCLKNGRSLVLETKGEETACDRAKWQFLEEWIRAVNDHGGFGVWCWDVTRQPGDIRAILDKHNAAD